MMSLSVPVRSMACSSHQYDDTAPGMSGGAPACTGSR